MNIGKAIKYLREVQDLRAQDLARKAGVSPAMVSAVENGDRSPSVPLIRKLATALGIPFEALLLAAHGDAALSTHDEAASRLLGVLRRLEDVEQELSARVEEFRK